jgi:hypothetical protein
MCHFIRVKLSPAEKKEVRKLSGAVIPIYASVALVLFALTLFLRAPNSGEAVAVAKKSPPASDTRPASR